MRRWLVLLLVLAGCGGGTASDGGKDTLPGALPSGVRFTPVPAETGAAPPFSLTLLDGTKVASAALWSDRPVVVFFLSSWCTRCATQQDGLAKVMKAYGDVVTFVGVAVQDKPDKLKPWLADHDVSYPVGIDADLAIYHRYAIRTPPGVVLIAPGGKLFRGWPGGVDSATLDEALGQLVIR